jgi:hypothetical protein
MEASRASQMPDFYQNHGSISKVTIRKGIIRVLSPSFLVERCDEASQNVCDKEKKGHVFK